jgi:putative acetyltransferase
LHGVEAVSAERQERATLRPFLPADAPVLAAIFEASILELTGEDYSEAQREAWAATVDDEEAFAARLAGQTTLVASLAGAPVGFASLKRNDEIDMLYVHPAAVGRGVATVLIDALEKLAAGRGMRVLAVDASDTARGFFEKRGYSAERRNTVSLGEEWLGNTTMKKKLAPAAPRRVQ